MPIDNQMEKFKQVPSAYITDAMRRAGHTTGWSCGLKPLSPTARSMAGRAVTLKYGPKQDVTKKQPGQFQIVRDCQPGDVLIFAAKGSGCWLTGGNVAQVAMYQGLAGIAVDGCLRDADEVGGLQIPVFCLGAGVRPYAHELALIDVNVPVDFAGTEVRPGDIVIGDGDGIVVVPADQADDVTYQLGDIEALEKELEEAIRRKAPVEELDEIAMRKSKPRKNADASA